MANDYITNTDIKNALPDGTWGSGYDTLLADLATSASRDFDRLTKREPGAYKVTADTTRYFDGSGHGTLWIGELAAAPTSVSMTVATPLGSYTALASTDYLLAPYNAALEGKPYTRLQIDPYNGDYAHWYRWPKAVKIVAKFGWSETVPADVERACLIMATRAFKRGQQAYQDVGAILELGQLRYVKGTDPEVDLILRDYLRTVV